MRPRINKISTMTIHMESILKIPNKIHVISYVSSNGSSIGLEGHINTVDPAWLIPVGPVAKVKVKDLL